MTEVEDGLGFTKIEKITTSDSDFMKEIGIKL